MSAHVIRSTRLAVTTVTAPSREAELWPDDPETARHGIAQLEGDLAAILRSAMAEEHNLEIVRSIYGAWQRGDYRSNKWADPKIEFVIADGPDRGSWTGVDEMARAARAALRAWDEHRLAADSFRSLDNERVLVLSHRTARGKASGLAVRAEGAELFHLRNGKVTKLVRYLAREKALAALGLSSAAE